MTAPEAAEEVWVEYSDDDLIAFHDRDGSLLLEAEAGDVARALRVPTWDLHSRLRDSTASGRLYRWSVGRFTLTGTESRLDSWRLLGARLDVLRTRRGSLVRSAPIDQQKPEEIDFEDLDPDDFDFLEDGQYQ